MPSVSAAVHLDGCAPGGLLEHLFGWRAAFFTVGGMSVWMPSHRVLYSAGRFIWR